MAGNPGAMSQRSGAIVRTLLAFIGVGAIAYAVSDHQLYGGGSGFGKVQFLIALFGSLLLLGSALSRKVAERLLLFAASLLLMLGVGEIAVSAILGSSLQPIYQYDDRLIFKLVPNSEGAVLLPPINGGETITHRVNSSGFRGPELASESGQRRIVVYGDSFIHAPYTKESETFARQLESMLSDRTRELVEVVNAGVSSYGPDQIALRFTDDVASLKPDLVVVAIFAGNDFGDLMRNKLFRIGDRGDLNSNTWALAEDVKRNFDLGQSESVLLRALKRAWDVLRAGFRDTPGADPQIPGLEQMLEVARAEYREYIVDRNNVVTNTHVDYYSADISLDPGGESSSYKANLMRLVLERIVLQARRADVPLMFVLIPHPADLMNEWEWGRVDLERYPDYKGRNQVGVLEAATASLRVPSVSLFDVFSQSDPKLLYLRGGDDHWNSAGQRVAADEVARFIERESLLNRPKTGRPELRTGPTGAQ